MLAGSGPLGTRQTRQEEAVFNRKRKAQEAAERAAVAAETAAIQRAREAAHLEDLERRRAEARREAQARFDRIGLPRGAR
jgi:hypothetical protein